MWFKMYKQLWFMLFHARFTDIVKNNTFSRVSGNTVSNDTYLHYTHGYMNTVYEIRQFGGMKKQRILS